MGLQEVLDSVVDSVVRAMDEAYDNGFHDGVYSATFVASLEGDNETADEAPTPSDYCWCRTLRIAGSDPLELEEPTSLEERVERLEAELGLKFFA